jgi:hypothetical protein
LIGDARRWVSDGLASAAGKGWPIGPGRRRGSKTPKRSRRHLPGYPRDFATTQACAGRRFVEHLAGGCLGERRTGLTLATALDFAIVAPLLLTAIVEAYRSGGRPASARTGLLPFKKN